MAEAPMQLGSSVLSCPRALIRTARPFRAYRAAEGSSSGGFHVRGLFHDSSSEKKEW